MVVIPGLVGGSWSRIGAWWDSAAAVLFRSSRTPGSLPKTHDNQRAAGSLFIVPVHRFPGLSNAVSQVFIGTPQDCRKETRQFGSFMVHLKCSPPSSSGILYHVCSLPSVCSGWSAAQYPRICLEALKHWCKIFSLVALLSLRL